MLRESFEEDVTLQDLEVRQKEEAAGWGACAVGVVFVWGEELAGLSPRLCTAVGDGTPVQEMRREAEKTNLQQAAHGSWLLLVLGCPRVGPA